MDNPRDLTVDERAASVPPADLGAYCRSVESHLTRVNGGHLVRIVGPGFDVVRRWAADGVPLSVVFRGIELKAARHQAGASKRPLRVEFCDDDVRELFDDWRRAIGLAPAAEDAAGAGDADGASGAAGASDAAGAAPAADAPRGARRPATRDLDRAIERLGRASGRLDWPEALRDAIGAQLSALVAIRDECRGARGDARAAALAGLADADRAFGVAIGASAPAADVSAARADAERELAPYRDRLPATAWSQAVATTADRLLRERLGLPI